jgi:hypothetical protein
MKIVRLPILFLLVFFGIFAESATQENQKIKNIEAFAKTYSQVRYFYPGDQAADFDWNTFIIYGTKMVARAESENQLFNILEYLYTPIIPHIYFGYNPQSKNYFDRFKKNKKAELVAWQHFGIGAYLPHKIYKCKRYNKDGEYLTEDGFYFGSIRKEIFPDKIKGKKFRLRVKMKVKGENPNSNGRLWIRIESNDSLLFFENMENLPAYLNSWQEYTIEGFIDTSATSINIGAGLFGFGQLLIDDLEFFILDDGYVWQKAPLKNSDFETESVDDIPGFYWFEGEDNYSFEVVKDGYKSKKCLKIENQVSNFENEIIRFNIDKNYISKIELVDDIICQFPIVLESYKGKTEAPKDLYDLNMLIQQFESLTPSDFDIHNKNVQVANFIIIWSVISQSFPYQEDINADWEKWLVEGISGILKAETIEEYEQQIRIFLEKLKDGQAELIIYELGIEKGFLPFKLKWYKNQLFVSKTSDPSIVRVGDEVITINGKLLVEYISKNNQYFSGSDRFKKVKILNDLEKGKHGEKLKLGLIRENDVFEKEVYYQDIDFSFDSDTLFEIDSQIFYLDFSNPAFYDVEEIVSEIEDARGIIIDLSNNPQYGHQILGYLIKENDSSKNWMRVPEILYPAYKNVNYRNYGWELSSITPKINGKVVFLVDASTHGYGESILGFVENYNLGIIVGQTTAGINGNINRIPLFGNYEVTFTGMKVVKHNGEKLFNKGFEPDVFVEISDPALSNEDIILKKALYLIKNE